MTEAISYVLGVAGVWRICIHCDIRRRWDSAYPARIERLQCVIGSICWTERSSKVPRLSESCCSWTCGGGRTRGPIAVGEPVPLLSRCTASTGARAFAFFIGLDEGVRRPKHSYSFRRLTDPPFRCSSMLHVERRQCPWPSCPRPTSRAP